jgi:hypothetical protein
VSRRANVVRHGANHKGRNSSGTGGGSDPSVLNVDSTENVSDDQGVHSVSSAGNHPTGYYLQSTGDGGSLWGPGNSQAYTSYRECTLARATLIELWPLNEASGDAVGVKNGYVLTENQASFSGTTYPVHGDPGPFTDVPTDTSCRFGGTEVGAGTADNFETADAAVTAFIGTGLSWTAEAWIYPTALPTSSARIMTASGGLAADKFSIVLGSNSRISVGYASGGIGGTAADAVSLNTWTHVRATVDSGATATIYINGVQTSTGAVTGSVGGNFAVGNDVLGATGKRPFLGRVADVALYNSVVTAFCGSVGSTGPGSGSGAAIESQVATADGTGGITWAYPTIEVEF